MNESEPTLIFLHIPKAAGTTLQAILARHFSPDRIYAMSTDAEESVKAFIELPADRRAHFRLVMGHMSFGLHRNIPRPATYITLLRDPLERTLSYYNYVRTTPRHALHRHIAVDGLGLKEFLEQSVTRDLDNGQTRLISGAWNSVADGACTLEMLAQAKDNLRAHFSLVGLAEEFDRSLVLLSQRFGWRDLAYRRRNVAAGRLSVRRLPADALAAVRRANVLDEELYAFASSLYHSRWRRVGTAGHIHFLIHRLGQRAQPFIPPFIWRKIDS
ncbi:MAG: sulfotransferase family 2 domain-containing protein [Candidatus Promineifilaceae bacterium]